MLKKKITLSVVSSMLLALFSVSSASAAVPGNSIIIGSKAYDIELLFNPSYVTEVNAALGNANGVMYYNLGGDTFFNIMTNSVVTDNELSQLPAVTFVDSQGKQTVYQAGNGDPVSLAKAEVTVKSGAISSFKQITVNSASVDGAQKFALKDLSSNSMSVAAAIGETTTVMTSESSLELYILDASGGELASGVLAVSSDGNVTVQLTTKDTSFEVISID